MQSSLEMLPAQAQDMLARLAQAPEDRATVIGLSGELGAGKTTLTQALARELGVTEQVTSPTFVIAKPYKTADERFQRLIHIDAYRVESVDELKALRWDEMLLQANTLIVIEWPERIETAMPADSLRATLQVTGDDTREFSYA